MNNGWIKLHRKLLESEVWLSKPSTWGKIWIYILEKVSHTTSGKLKKGMGYFNFSQEKSLIGCDITKDMIKSFCQYARKNEMIATTKTTRGMYIEVLKYSTYQDIDTDEPPPKPQSNHHRTTTEPPLYNKNVRIKEDKKDTANGVPSQDIQSFINLFKEVNPSYEMLFRNTTERGSATRLLKKYGMEKMESTLLQLPSIIKQPYAPKITTPYELERNLGKLIAFVEQNKTLIKSKNKVAFI